MALIDKLNAIGDAIRAKTGKSDKLTLDQMPGEIAGIITNEDLNDILTEQEGLIAQLQTELIGKTAGGTSDEKFNAFVERTATEFENSTLQTISQYICYNFTTLKIINFPNLTTLGGHAFYNCTSLTNLTTNKLKSIGTYAFYNCIVFNNNNYPEVTAVGSYAFRQCRKLTSAIFPKIASLGNYAMSRCNLLSKVDFGPLTAIPAQAFAEDSNLVTLILRKTENITTLDNTSAFSGTKIASGTGYIYVPSSLIETYKAATNWSTYADQFRAIEDYPEICGGGN